MINRKGQGSIEYLMILAAVLAIAVVVVVLATTFFVRYKEPAEVSQDKSVCATSGIKLENYNSRFVGADQAAASVSVTYLGTIQTCSAVATTPGGESSCKIGVTNKSCVRIYVNQSTTSTCRLKNFPLETC